MTAVAAGWAGQFGEDYAVPAEITGALPDVSWHNDACPAFGRLPRTQGQTSADALVAVGISASDAPLLVSTFGDLAALYRIAHGQQQQVGNNDFFFSARQLLGTQPMP